MYFFPIKIVYLVVEEGRGNKKQTVDRMAIEALIPCQELYQKPKLNVKAHMNGFYI